MVPVRFAGDMLRIGARVGELEGGVSFALTKVAALPLVWPTLDGRVFARARDKRGHAVAV